MVSRMPMSMKISDALAQLDLLAGVLLLSAQTRSMMKLTTGMSMRIIVIIQSPTETTDVLRENCSCFSILLHFGLIRLLQYYEKFIKNQNEKPERKMILLFLSGYCMLSDSAIRFWAYSKAAFNTSLISST